MGWIWHKGKKKKKNQWKTKPTMRRIAVVIAKKSGVLFACFLASIPVYTYLPSKKKSDARRYAARPLATRKCATNVWGNFV